jgi:Uma2 family endonuclease
MSTAAQPHITLEEFIARLDREDDQREELIEGEPIVSPGAKPSHASIVGGLRAQLPLLQDQGYELANDFSCILGGGAMPVPDLPPVEHQQPQAAAESRSLSGTRRGAGLGCLSKDQNS